MDIKELEEIMISEGIVLRAIPSKTVGIYEKYHINEFPHGTIQYLDEYKREMLVVESIPELAGKFLLQTAKHQNCIVRFDNKELFDSIEDAMKKYMDKVHETNKKDYKTDIHMEQERMKSSLLSFLQQFMIQSDWYYENSIKQARAIFTALCFIGNMEADTKECDDILLDLYDKAAFDESYSFDEFTSYMVELIV